MITKSDYLKFLTCPAYFWFHKKEPSVLVEKEISDFQKELIESGKEVEAWARKRYPSGILVESREDQAVSDTKKLLDEGKKVIFQATIEAEGLYVMVDILEWDEKNGHWIINEVKGSTSDPTKMGDDKKSKKEHEYDASFQYIVLKKAGMNVGKVNLLELNKEYVRNGEINVVQLINPTDITEKAHELEEEINGHIDQMRMLMDQESEPQPCDCVYKSRANHCPAFGYLYPNMPEYSVHDIALIGLSPKRLGGLIEGGYLSIYDVPEDFELSKNQRSHVDVTQTRITVNKSGEIKKLINKMEYPFYYLDYETYPTAVPIYDGCKPYMQIPFQYSLHIQREPDGEYEHYEFLADNGDENPMKALTESLKEHIGDGGSIIVWNKKFEKKCNENIGEVYPEYAELMNSWNERLFDLMDVFQQNLYVHKDFKGKYSIKKVLPVFDPELSYKDLNVQDGSMAMDTWRKMVFDDISEAEKEKNKKDLLEYCERDTWAMVRIYEELVKKI
ncbi:MAG: DUF2779 domain-containing protein [Nanoarchaeota archaeon]|nr:DUF2779 domain-containing protein [Nanoarchaeota archaeon]